MEQKLIQIFRDLYLEVADDGSSTHISTLLSAPIRVYGNAVAVSGLVKNSSNLAAATPLTIGIYGAIDPNTIKLVASTSVSLTSGEPTPFALSPNTAWVYPEALFRLTIASPASGTARMVVDLYASNADL